MGDDGAILIKPSSVGEYTSRSCVILYAGFSATCNVSNEREVTLYEESNTWSTNNEPDDIDTYDENRIVSRLNISSSGDYIWDVTDCYIKWDRGVLENNGFFFAVDDADSTYVSNFAFVVRFSKVEANDIDYTYHSFNMNRAGTLNINDVTNSIIIEQKLLEFTYGDSSFAITRKYNSSNPSFTDQAGIGFSFNYESSIVLQNNFAEWNMIGGNITRYKPSSPLVTNGNYQKWSIDENSCKTGINADLWIDSYAIADYTSPQSFDYTNLYIIIEDVKYSFNSTGNLISVSNVGNNSTILLINYSNGKISQIENSDGDKIKFTYISSPLLGITYLNKIEAIDSEDSVVSISPSEYARVSFSLNVVDSNTIVETITYGNGDNNSYVFDNNCHLISATDENCNTYFFTYVNNTGSYVNSIISSYEAYRENENNPYDSLSINAEDTYKRIYTYIDGSTETIRFDKYYKTIAYKDSNNDYKFIEYDETGMAAKYICSIGGENFVINSGFEDGKSVPGWTRSNSNNISRKSNYQYDGNYSLLMTREEIGNLNAYQIIKTNNTPKVFEADVSYIYSCCALPIDMIPGNDGSVCIEIMSLPISSESSNTDINNYSSIGAISIDTTINGSWQLMASAFKLETNSYIAIKINYNQQISDVYFDDIMICESGESLTDLVNIATSSPINYTYNNGRITGETITWERENEDNLSMSTSYIYNNSNKLQEITDYNGISTFYSYRSTSGQISGMGHTKDLNGNITDITSLSYDANSSLRYTSQIIKNIDTNSNITLSTEYENEFGNVVSVCRNGVIYNFVYDNETGLIDQTYAESNSVLEPSYNDYSIDYTYDSDNNLSIIEFSNGYKIYYSSSSSNQGAETKIIQCYYIDLINSTETLFKSYTYNFDSNGNLTTINDSFTGLTITYIDNNNSYTIIDSNNQLLYQKEIDSYGNITETYSQYYYNQTNNSNTDVIETSNSSVSYNNSGLKFSNSTVSIEKNAYDYISSFNYNRESVRDYFDRIQSKTTSMDYQRSSISGNLSVSNEYEYCELGNGFTSGLIAEYNSTLYSENPINNSTTNHLSYSRKYEYDSRGNISFVYEEGNGGIIIPKNYYEYDNANQIITEIDFDKGLCAHYTYDAGGNITAKIYYDFSQLTFNITNREITTLGSEVNRITYQYDNIWKDRLTNYNGTPITYDYMGNPLNFVGINHDNEIVTGTLEWAGNLLSAFETTNERYEYHYDANGFRTQKTVFNISNGSYIEAYRIRYLWDNGVLIGMLYSGTTNNTHYPDQNIEIIYDEEGSPVGWITALGVPYLFIKDISENVISMRYTDGSYICNYSYDSWGNPKTIFWGNNLAQRIISKITAIFCPVTYHGYLYDFETGLYFNQGRCYSPCWGRYINPEDPINITDSSTNPLDSNLYLFCNNNTVNTIDRSYSCSKNFQSVIWKANGFDVVIDEQFSSRLFCMVFASQVIKNYGTWDMYNGYNYLGMNSLRIASDLFAHYVGKNAKSAINRVNACWGDGWILNSSKTDIVFVRNDDINAQKYIKVWKAAPEIKAYAQKEGIYIKL